ncbi:MAG: hypothetical protein GY720_18470 [bacterium]|nr:hypothetical protein [bacterium]
MSVDTNTDGKNLNPYERMPYEGVEFLLPRNLMRWAADVTVDARRSLLGTRFIVQAGHAHNPT